jgi:hypothetical protein
MGTATSPWPCSPWPGSPLPAPPSLTPGTAQAAALATELWPKAGQRAWQYAGQLESGPCTVRGATVEIDVADSGVLTSLGAASTGPIWDPGHHPGPRTCTVQPGGHVVWDRRQVAPPAAGRRSTSSTGA